MKQHYVIKFCVKLKENSSKMYKKFKICMLMILYLMPKFFLGTRCFHKVKKRYEMSLSLGAHSPEDWTLTYNVQRLASIKINI
jgi:hypothetical protein